MIDEETRRTLNLFLDDELEGAEREVFRRRIETSPELQAEMRDIEKTTTAMGRYFSGAAGRAKPDSASEGRAVERIVRETTILMSKKRRGGPTFMVVVLGLVAVGIVTLAVKSLLSSAPEPLDLMANAEEQLTGNYYEIEFETGSLLGRIENMIRASGLVEGADLDASMQAGPDGRVHLATRAEVDGIPVESHAGFDGERYWLWATGMETVPTMKAPTMESRRPDLPVLMWRDLLETISRLRTRPDALEVLGRERTPGAGTEELWRLDVRGGGPGERATLWFDDDGDLQRISFAGFQVRLLRRSALGPADFEIENWAPGVPTVEEGR